MGKKITFSNKFKRDVAKQIQKTLTAEWIEVIDCLMKDLPLPEKYCDHQLKGNLKDYRDCHVENDLVLLYSKYDDEVQLVRLGSHSELFG